MENESKITFMVLVTERKHKEALLSMLHEIDVNLVNVIYGRGAAKGGFLLNVLGLTSEENKVVISCVTTHTKSETVLSALVEKFHFDKPNTGIVFTVPVESVAY